MNKYLKSFLHRGLIFGGFGPVILAIVYTIIEKNIEDFSLNSTQLLVSIISVYLLAFLQAGASVFNQIEEWSLPKSLLCHFSTLYFAYVICYLVNKWIPFNLNILLTFTAVFIFVYLIIWLIVFICVKLTSKKLNSKLI